VSSDGDQVWPLLAMLAYYWACIHSMMQGQSRAPISLWESPARTTRSCSSPGSQVFAPTSTFVMIKHKTMTQQLLGSAAQQHTMISLQI
jgi:hypothetical protein